VVNVLPTKLMLADRASEQNGCAVSFPVPSVVPRPRSELGLGQDVEVATEAAEVLSSAGGLDAEFSALPLWVPACVAMQ
jgi:hypothetical protein